MEKPAIIVARELVNYIKKNSDLQLIQPKECEYKNHIGALFTDIILQSGVNYRTVVAPRVKFVLEMYPIAFSVENFFSTINEYGIENVLQWNHAVKLQRMIDLLHFCRQNNLNTSVDVQHFLLTYSNQILFLSINGIGYKTLDYLLKLMNIETVAVDRHIYSFVEKAGIISKDYLFVKTVVEYAADLMGVSRRSIDYSIWSYMSNESSSKSKQLSLCF